MNERSYFSRYILRYDQKWLKSKIVAKFKKFRWKESGNKSTCDILQINCGTQSQECLYVMLQLKIFTQMSEELCRTLRVAHVYYFFPLCIVLNIHNVSFDIKLSEFIKWVIPVIFVGLKILEFHMSNRISITPVIY